MVRFILVLNVLNLTLIRFDLVRPAVVVEQEAGTSIVKISNLRIKFTEGLPKNEANHAVQMSGLDVALKCKFLSPESEYHGLM